MAVGEQINSLIESIKNFWSEFDFRAWTEKIGANSGEAFETAIYFGLSFAVGFFLRRYGRHVLFALIVSVFIIKGLEHFNFLTIDWDTIKTAFGIGLDPDGGLAQQSVIATAAEWIKANVILSIAAAVGFLIGYKVG